MGVTMKTYEDDIDVLAKPTAVVDKRYVITEDAPHFSADGELL